MGRRVQFFAWAAAASVPSAALGSFTVYNETSAAWFSTAPGATAITFAELPANTQVTEQYASLGVHFTDLEGNWIWPATDFGLFPQDGWGLRGYQVVEMTFDAPMSAVASFHPSFTQFKFYSGTTLLYQSTVLGGSNGGHFTGFTTDTPFDRVVVTGLPAPPPFDSAPVNFDSIYFSTVPGPGGIAVLLGVALGARRRRNSQ